MAVFTEAYTNTLLNRDPIQEAVDTCSQLLQEAFEELDYELNILKESEGEDEEGKKKGILEKVRALIVRFINWVNAQVDKIKDKIAKKREELSKKKDKEDSDSKEDVTVEDLKAAEDMVSNKANELKQSAEKLEKSIDSDTDPHEIVEEIKKDQEEFKNFALRDAMIKAGITAA